MFSKPSIQFLTRSFVALGAAVLASASIRASDITTPEIVPIPQHVTGSGNGTLDLRMFTYSGSEIPNKSGNQPGDFNGDNGNNSLPQGGGSPDIGIFGESYITTAGDLKAFFNLNFAPNSVHNLFLLLDLNETGDGQPINSLDKLDIILNPATVQGSPNPVGDVSSAEQVAIKQVYTGGTKIAQLNPQPADNLPVNSQGAGFADYAIFTGIDPFTLNDSDVLLFNVSMSHLNNGAEEIFLSGTYAAGDILLAPEPGSASLLAFGGIGLALWRRLRR
jgi:hypothetical protein